MEDEPTLMDMFKGLARRWKLNVSTLRRGISTLLVSVFVMCLTLATPGHVCAALSSSLTGTINVVSGNVTIQGKTDAGALVVINGRQFRASAAGTFSASFPLAGTATIAVVGTNRAGFSMLLNLPAISSVARHVLPAMTFSYDGTSRTLGLAGKLTHKPAGAVKGYVTDAETRRSISFAVGKDYLAQYDAPSRYWTQHPALLCPVPVAHALHAARLHRYGRPCAADHHQSPGRQSPHDGGWRQ